MIMALPFLLAAFPQVVPQVVPPLDGCLPIQDDRIYARDVAAAVPAFANVAADFAVGYAPAPGTRRVFKGDALERLARNQGVAVESAPDVCFERAMATLAAGEILEAMHSAWGVGNVPSPDVRMELRSFSPQIAPQGKVVFPRMGLQLPATSDPQAEVVWRGYVLYGNNRRFGITARARITTTTTRVIALADLSVGEPVHEDQVRLESFDTFALDDRPARNLDEVVGFVPRTLIRSGATVLRSQLGRAPEVARGDVVKVEVTAGGAHLLFEGRAENDGVEGKTILVKNLTSGKDFRARVTGKGMVSVQ
jgi:flagella basal body P-ring formation protein FlgA